MFHSTVKLCCLWLLGICSFISKELVGFKGPLIFNQFELITGKNIIKNANFIYFNLNFIAYLILQIREKKTQSTIELF